MMPNKVLSIYKIQLLLSLTLSIVLIAMRVEKNAFNIVQIFLGAFVGTFLLDLDYFIHAYFLDPTADFSKTLVSYVKHKDIKSAFAFIYYHRHDIKEKTLNSALFQIAIGAGAIFVVSSNASLFVKSLVISTYINSIYRLAELYFEKNDTSEWFWALKKSLTGNALFAYFVALLGLFVYVIFAF